MSAFLRFWRGDDCERGQAIILIAAVLLGMLMSVGLAIDAGTLYVARRTAQEAADAGAYAGAVVLYEGGAYSDAKTAAATDATKNGYTQGGDGGRQTVIVQEPTASPFNNTEYVEVDISVDVRTSLVPRSGLTQVSVHSIAGAVPLNNKYAIMALDRGNTPNALYINNTGTLTLSGGGILVNSTSSTAAYNVDTGTPPANVTITSSSSGTVVAGGVTGGWPSLATGQTQQPDPFAGYPKPSVTGMNTYSSLPAPVNTVITINPGIYTVPLQAAGGTTILMNSGTYILEAGINGSGNADVKSNTGGVFIFNTLTNYPNSTGGDTCQGVKLTGTSATDLNPETSGTYQGLLFYQDPACTAQFLIEGTSTMTVSGSIYVPKAQVEVAGSADLNGSQIVADTVKIQSGTVQVSFDTGSTAQPVLPRLAQ
ncbi:MAG: hypothetical protein KGJ98_13470 [Chloroflexota bacterium]|nr:hypothetical protein [Chloroflexota bacterium]